MHNNIHVNYANNVYRNRGGVSSQSYTRTGGIATRTMNYNRPTINSANTGGNLTPRNNNAGTRPGSTGFNNQTGTNGSAAGRPNNGSNISGGTTRPSVYSDHQGNVYQRPQANSNWQQRQNRAWAPVNSARPEVQNLDRQQVNRSRGETRAQNFQRIPSSPSSGGYRPSSGGGSRPSGGGGGGSHPSGGGSSRSGGGGRH